MGSRRASWEQGVVLELKSKSSSHSCGFTSYDYRPESFEVVVENGRIRFVGLFWRREFNINPKEKFLPAGKKFVSEITGQPLSISSLLTV